MVLLPLIKRSKITITSDFAQYNYVNQNAKFYNNVVIKYDMKVINCDNVDINIDENIAIAYSNVVVEDNESVMKAQVVTIDIITKDIEINSEDKQKFLRINGSDKKFRIKSYETDKPIVELKNVSVFYNKRQI